jgi:hypothetical protein
MLPSPEEPAAVVTKTANRIEVFHNLKEDGTHEKPVGNSPVQLCTNNSNQKIGGHLQKGQ